MTDQQAAAPGAADGSDIVQVALAGNELPSLRAAARAVADAREKRNNPEQPSQDSSSQDPVARAAATQDPAHQSVEETGAAPQDAEVPGEIEAAEPPAEAPIEPPRSWTKAEKERFQSLPRETQEYLASREQERDRATRQSQNEAAEQRKTMEAERGKVEQARTHYETALPQVLAVLEQQRGKEFADLKSFDDVERLAREDWPRYVLWDAQQKRIAGIQQEMQQAGERQAQEKAAKFAEFAQRETELLAEKVPELADPVKGPALKDAAVATLRELGFSDAELGALWRGDKELSLHDHRLQLLIRDGVRYRSAQAAAKNPARPNLPPVQRPGTAPPRGAQAAAAVQNLNERLNKTGSLKDATRLLTERRKAAR